jgi:hypothetical protein
VIWSFDEDAGIIGWALVGFSKGLFGMKGLCCGFSDSAGIRFRESDQFWGLGSKVSCSNFLGLRIQIRTWILKRRRF